MPDTRFNPAAGRELSPDDALPPVEPPSAGFIVQLFVIPGVIVTIIVMVWLMFNWLAHMGSDPASYVTALERNNEARWQAAHNLANALRSEQDPGAAHLKNSGPQAARVGQILARELKAGSTDDKLLTLRVFLCRALGEFNVPEGLPALIEAAATARSEKENEVRRAALEGIAVLVQKLHQNKIPVPEQSKLQRTLVAASADADPLVRSAAAFAMGVVGGPRVLDELEGLLADSYPDVRYNAATGLARHGDARAVAVLAEMLDSEQTSAVEVEREQESRAYKRAMIINNGLTASRQLARKNATADLSPLAQAAEKLSQTAASREVRVESAAVWHELKRRKAPPDAAGRRRRAAFPASPVERAGGF